MTSIDRSVAAGEPPSGAWLKTAGNFLRQKRTLILVSIGIATAGLALNWNWLVAAGIAPVLVSVLPCAAMCALGLCMKDMRGNGSCSKSEAADGNSSEFARSATTTPGTAGAPRAGVSEA